MCPGIVRQQPFKSDERKEEGTEEAQNSETFETAKAEHPEGAKEIA